MTNQEKYDQRIWEETVDRDYEDEPRIKLKNLPWWYEDYGKRNDT